jgi:UDP-glucose 4-epimerase
LIDIVARVTGREVSIDRIAKPATFVDRVVLDIGRFSSEFGLTPAVTLEDGIAATWRARIEGVE